MTFNETLKIDEAFSFDEEHNLFRYNTGNGCVISPICNVKSCMVMADIASIDREYFCEESVPDFGKVPFVKDIKKFSKAVMENGVVLTICYLNEAGEMNCYRKSFRSQDRQPYEIMSRINKMLYG